MNKLILGTLVSVFTFSANLALAQDFKIDTQESTVAWKGTKKVGSFHVGKIGVKEGQITLDKKNKVTGANIVMDMSKISNEDLTDAAYNKKLVGHLSSEDFFNIAKYPTSSFALKSVVPGKGKKNEVLVKGDLTMIGQTHPVEFPAIILVDKGVVTGEGKLIVNRTTWGLKYGSGNFFKELTGDKIINDDFELELKIVAKK